MGFTMKKVIYTKSLSQKDVYIVIGPQFKNEKLDSLEAAKIAVNVKLRKGKDNYKKRKREIIEFNKQIKKLQKIIDKNEKWLSGH